MSEPSPWLDHADSSNTDVRSSDGPALLSGSSDVLRNRGSIHSSSHPPLDQILANSGHNHGAPLPIVATAEDSSPSHFLYLLIAVLALGGFLFGYDTGIVAGALLPIKEEFSLSSTQQEMVVSGTTIGAIVGGLMAGALSDVIGRRLVTLLSSAIFLVGAAMLTFAHKYWLLIFGRIVVGVGVGLAALVVPLYIGELAPSAYRGRLVTMNVLTITGGQLVAYVISWGMTNVTNGWRWMMAISAIPAILQLVTLPFLPESPRYLVRRGKISQAQDVLRKCMGVSDANNSYIHREVAAIQESLDQSKKSRYSDLFAKSLRKPLIMCCGLQLFQQLSGFNTAMYYSATILRMAGFPDAQSATAFSIIIAATNILMTIVAINIIDRVGRRRILLWTIVGMVIGLVVLGGAFIWLVGFTSPSQESCAGDNCPTAPTNAGASWLALVSLVFYVASYALGLGNAPWLIQSESFPLDIRGKATGLCTATNFAGNLVISLTFLTLTEAITATGTFWLYAGIMIIGWFFVFFLVPETAGLTLEEIQALFAPGLSARKAGQNRRVGDSAVAGQFNNEGFVDQDRKGPELFESNKE